jgi:transcriptional regulator with XRE-family HTH domain
MDIPSKFASLLRRMLDESGIFNRSDWATYLGVSEPAISQWLNDHTLPKAEHLRKIIWTLRNKDAVPKTLVTEYEEMLQIPASEISIKHYIRIGNTLGDYVISPLVKTFLMDLKRLRPVEQEELLLLASEKCAEVRGIIPRSDGHNRLNL